jgi:hypothetical protein
MTNPRNGLSTKAQQCSLISPVEPTSTPLGTMFADDIGRRQIERPGVTWRRRLFSARRRASILIFRASFAKELIGLIDVMYLVD